MEPNWIDKIVAYVSPKSGERRLRARIIAEALLSYEGARTSRRQGGWNTSGTSGNSEIGVANSKLRANANDLCRNNAFALKAKREWSKRVVGTGITPRPKTGSDRLNTQILKYWDQWTRECCSDNRINFYAAQKLIVGSRYVSGESIVRLWDRPTSDALTVPFQIQVLESDYIDDTKTTSMDNGYIIQGVEFDPIGRIRGYWLFSEHPDEVVITSFRSSSSKFVPAKYILHHLEIDRPGDARAVSRFAAVISKLRDLDEYEDAELVRKKICACMTAIFTQAEGADGPTIGAVTTNDSGQRTEQFAPGTIVYAPPGFDAKTFTPADNSNYSEYKKTELREVAVGLGIPYILLDDNMEAVNYSSFRGGMLSFREEVEEYRYNWLIPQVLDPIYAKFIDKLFTIGAISEPNADVEWNPPQFDLLDRMAEAEADQLELQIGKTTWPQLISRTGYDPEKQIAEINQYKEQLEEAGISFSQNPPPPDPKQGADNAKTE